MSDSTLPAENGEAVGDPVDGSPEPHDPQLVVIARFDDPHEFQLARGLLESEGIDAMSFDLFVTTVDWTLMNLLGQIKLAVPEPQVERAVEILRETPARSRLTDATIDRRAAFAKPVAADTPDGIDVAPSADTFDACPACGSARTVIHSTFAKRMMLLTWLAGILLPFWFGRTSRFRCKDCGTVFDPR